MKQVEKQGEVVMLFGDSFTDFGDLSKSSLVERDKQLNDLKDKFGDMFIVFPNPMYGAFERALYKQEKVKTTKDKIRVRQNILKGYK